MNKFTFASLVGQSEMRSTALGVSNAAPFGDNDKNKAVKLAANHNYVLVAAGDELEAVVNSLEPNGVNNGFSFGTIYVNGYMEAKVDNAVVTVGALVVAGAQAALGTAQDYPVVRPGAPTKFLWRVVDLLTGAGAVGSIVVIEKI